MFGKIALEECWTVPEELANNDPGKFVASGTGSRLTNELLDIHEMRLHQMDESNVDFMVLSFNAPGCQGIADRARAEAQATLANDPCIKINQDPNVGASISPFRWGINPDYVSNSSYPAQYWSGNSSYGVVFMVLNTEDTSAQMFFNLTESLAIAAGRQYSVYDMWSHTENGTAVRNMTFTLLAHGVAALLLNDAGPEPADASPPYCAVWYQCSFPNGTYYSN